MGPYKTKKKRKNERRALESMKSIILHIHLLFCTNLYKKCAAFESYKILVSCNKLYMIFYIYELVPKSCSIH
jgi:hypothetical protein